MFFVLACLPIIQWSLGLVYFEGDALIVCFYLLGVALALSCGNNCAMLGYKKQALTLIAILFFVLSFVNVLFALHQYFSLHFLGVSVADISSTGRSYGNLRQSNNFASLLLICLLFGVYLFEQRYFSRPVYYVWILFVIAGLVLAQSRTSLLGVACIFMAYCIFVKRVSFRSRLPDWLWVLLCYLFMYVFWGYLQQLVLENEFRSFAEANTSGRISIWYEALLAIKERPWLGYGWNQIGVAQVLLESPLDSVVHFRHAHNLLLDLILYNGVFIGSTIIVFFMALLWGVVKACHTVEDWCILTLVMVVGIHAMLEYPLHYAYFLLLIAFLVGLVGNEPFVRFNMSLSFRYPALLNIPVIGCIALTLWLLFSDYRVITEEVERMHVEQKGMFERDVSSENTHNILLLSQMREFITFSRMNPLEVLLSEDQIRLARRISHRFPSPYLLSKYARICHLAGRDEEADRVLGVIKRLFGAEVHVYSVSQVYDHPDK